MHNTRQYHAQHLKSIRQEHTYYILIYEYKVYVILSQFLQIHV